MHEVEQLYFDWIVRLVRGESYSSLLAYLMSREYIPACQEDMARKSDGLYLRNRFGMESGLGGAYCLNPELPCTILEMMAALALRCDEEYMRGIGCEDRTYQWFMVMLESMQIDILDDLNYNESAAETAVDILLTRSYQSDGRGGLFQLVSDTDMRTANIWHQLMMFVHSYSEFGGI